MGHFLIGLFILATMNGTGNPFERQWLYASETSAVVYWQLGDISEEAFSYVEYGETNALGEQTKLTKETIR
jgi:hypothetical protein